MPPLAGGAAAAAGGGAPPGASPNLRSEKLKSNSPVLVSSKVRSLEVAYTIGPKLMPLGTRVDFEKTECIITRTGVVRLSITSVVIGSR